MNFVRKVFDFSVVEDAVARILREADEHADAGEREFWVTYTQDDIAMRKSAWTMAPLVRRRIARAGYDVVESRRGEYGDDVRLKVRRPAG